MGWSTLPILLAIMMGTSCLLNTQAAAVDRVRRQAAFTCESDTTMIYSPWIYSDDTSCGDLIGGVTDFYNPQYLSECQRQLGLATAPHSVEKANIAECYTFPNGTIKYRAKVCCPGTLDNMRCFVCKNSTIQYDAQKNLYVSDQCNHFESVETCPSGQVCATVYGYTATHYGVSKLCMDEMTCKAAQTDNPQTCRHGVTSPSCTYCCDSPLCNYYYRWSRYIPGNACYPNPCYHNSNCTLTGSTNSSEPAYTCHCREGLWGERCLSSPCNTYQPCKNLGVCYRATNAPYYGCYCRVGWHGINCTQGYEYCASPEYEGYCRNDGQCYDHETNGVRCKCQPGYYGKQCEFKAQGAERCNEPENYYNYTGLYYTGNGAYDCTNRSSYVRTYTSQSVGWVRNCVSYMRGGFVQGRDGDLTAMNMESMDTYYCERGDRVHWYQVDMCCPACTRKPCENGGWCIQKGDDFVCKCRLGFGGDRCQHKVATCFASGDPHYQSFDKRLAHFQGTCKYNLASSSPGDGTGMPHFKILTKNENRGTNHDVSYVRYTEVHVYGHVVRLDKNNKVYVDDVEVDPEVGASFENGAIKIMMNGAYSHVETKFGLVVENDGSWTTLVKLPANYNDMTYGLCGNSNADPGDDFVTSEGVDMTGKPNSYSIWGNSWQVEDPEDASCVGKVVPDPPDCTDMEEELKSKELCGLLIDSKLYSFRTCAAKLGDVVSNFAENCRYDVCAVSDDPDAMKEAACGTLQAVASDCANSGVLVNWRDEANCPLNCKGGREYKASAPACPVTCSTPNAAKECSLPDTETCACPDGQVLMTGQCVDHEECGCYDEQRQHYEVGEKWVSSDCNESYTCVFCTDCSDGFGKIVNEKYECPSDTFCNLGECEDVMTTMGITTTEDPDPCDSSPCKNGATCKSTGVTSYDCECPDGFLGNDCDILDPCHENPCENGGSCQNKENSAFCICAGHYSGDRCENHPCEPNPCENGGTCTSTGSSSYICACTAGYIGSDCGVKDPCYENPCKNGGSCQNKENNAFCICAGHYSGDRCENHPCEPNPCENGGTCTSTGSSSYMCACTAGYIGSDCDVKDPCYEEPCKNGGTCQNRNNVAHCECPSPYSGPFCEIHPCDSDPCQNGATCTALNINEYKCTCRPGYEGTKCEFKITYTYGSWSSWSCSSSGEEEWRERQCFKNPGNIPVNSNYCSGQDREEREVEVDCTKCEGLTNTQGYLSDPCSVDYYYNCQLVWGTWQWHRMPCGTCTRWSQETLTCVMKDGCKATQATTSTTSTTEATTRAANIDFCVTSTGSVYKAAAGKPNKYLWLVYGISFEMPCATGTKFDLDACGCIHGGGNGGTGTGTGTAPSKASEVTCIDFEVVNPWGFSGSQWKYITNVGPITQKQNCGVVGHCGNFDGNDHLEIPFFTNNYGTLKDHMSVSLWYKTEASSSYQQFLVRNGGCGVEDSFVVRIEAVGEIGAGVRTDATYDYINAFMGEEAQDNVWHHLVFVFDSSSDALYLYIDNVQLPKVTVDGTLLGKQCPMSIGTNFKGYMDEVCFYKTALTSSEVSSLFDSGKSVK